MTFLTPLLATEEEGRRKVGTWAVGGASSRSSTISVDTGFELGIGAALSRRSFVAWPAVDAAAVALVSSGFVRVALVVFLLGASFTGGILLRDAGVFVSFFAFVGASACSSLARWLALAFRGAGSAAACFARSSAERCAARYSAISGMASSIGRSVPRFSSANVRAARR